MLGLVLFLITTLVFIYGMMMKRKIVGTIGFVVMMGVFFFYPGVMGNLAEVAPMIGGPIKGLITN